MNIDVRLIDQLRPSLGRHVEHDERSRFYAFRRAVPIETRQWDSNVSVFDQGSLGSCTGNAGVGVLGYLPFYSTLPPDTILNQDLAISVYSEATVLDSFPGTYPPTDTGSSGIGVARALKARNLISGYLHAFSFLDALGALMDHPIIVGTNWYTSMFRPSNDGVISILPTDYVEGGHEYILDGYSEETGRLSFRNSWGIEWGVNGKFYMTTSTFQRLLGEDGDATVFVPLSLPAPVPTPPTPKPQGCMAIQRRK